MMRLLPVLVYGEAKPNSILPATVMARGPVSPRTVIGATPIMQLVYLTAGLLGEAY